MADAPVQASSQGQARKPTSPLVAVLLSGLFPGLGQLYNRERLKAFLFAVGGVLVGFGPFSPLDIDIDPGDLSAGLQKVSLALLPFVLIQGWSVIDAWRVARRSNPSVP